MPSIQTASIPVTSFPNEFVSPWGNDEVIPLYSSVPLRSPVVGCLPCVVCGISRQIIPNNTFESSTQISIQNSGFPYFDGFVYPEHKYSTVVLFDWDTCLFSGGIIDQSSTPIIVGSNQYSTSLWPVDGHVKVKATGINVGIVTEVTGGYASIYPLGSTQTITSVVDVSLLPNIIDDTHRYLAPNPLCGNPTGAWIQAVLLNRII